MMCIDYMYLFRCQASLLQLLYDRLSIRSPQIHYCLSLEYKIAT